MASQVNYSDDLNFDYDAVRLKYMSTVLKSHRHAPYSQYNLQKLVAKVKKFAIITVNNVMFEIATYNGDEILTCLKDHKTLQVLGSAECFDVFADLHLRESHAEFSKMRNILSGYFEFDDNFLKCFLLSCNVCAHQNSKRKDNNVYNSLVDILFLDLSACINVIIEYKYLLVHRDTASGYILLRPLIKLDAGEVASELYKIFIDFGPPERIRTTHTAFLKEVLELLTRTPIKYNCKVVENEIDGSDLMSKIADYFNNCKFSNCGDWAVACYVAQHKMNTEGDVPMAKVFGKKKHVNLTCEETSQTAQPLPSDGNNLKDNVSRESLRTTVDLDVCDGTVKPVPDENTSTVESIHSVACGSTSTKKESSDETLKCGVCKRMFMFTRNVHTCFRCKTFIHLFCGHRLIVDSDTLEKLKLVCIGCINS